MSLNNDDINYIKKIQFSIFSNEDIKDYSSITEEEGIDIAETYEAGEPKRGGLVDTRLGITDGNLECAYCGLNANYCQGHIGHTLLDEPIFHYGLLSHIKSILTCICLKSSKLLIDMNNSKYKHILELHGKNRFIEIKKLCSKITISSVGISVPKIKIDIKNSVIYFIAEYNISSSLLEEVDNKKKIKEILNAFDIYNIFKNISDNDWILMGFDPSTYRPESLLIINLPIPPVTIRPSLKTEYLAINTFEDSLVHNFIEIVKANNKLKKNKEKDNLGINNKYTIDSLNLLQYHVATMYDNESLSLPTNEQKIGGKPTKSISERLKGKTGRIRGNLMGKRVDYSARTVITSDPNIEIFELGVPLKIAMNLTFPEIVTLENKNELMKLVRNGRSTYPGSNYVKKKINKFFKNNMIDLRYRNNINLEIGDEVHRHIVDNDYVLFNRQPSLHKLSMMAHRIKVINDPNLYTFRMNVSATPPYNADFDGDEMNMFVPQSIQTTTELEHIANLKYQIISPRFSEPIITFVQDSVLGVYLLTKNNINLDWRDLMNLITICNNIDISNIQKNKDYKGKELYSKLIYSNINVNKDGTIIKNGNIVEGNIKKKVNELLVGNIWYKYGADKTSTYIFNVQRLISNWLLQQGFTCGIKDLIINNKVKISIIKEIEKKKMEINHLITEIENNPELIDPETFEDTVRENLKSHKGVIEKMVMSELDDNNNFYVMAKSGSKGKGINIMQMIGSLGQDILEFKRMEKTVNNRTLPHFFENDDRAEARGYIERSYLDGLNPEEFFFHNMASREGLIDTAIKTQDTGYISRKLMKGLEDIMVKYDGTVRTSTNKIIQFVYGDNGADQIKQTIQSLSLITKGDNKIMEDYCFTTKEIKELQSKFKIKNLDNKNKEYYNRILKYRDELRYIQKIYIQNYITIIDNYASPINFKRLIYDIINYKDINDKEENINPEYIYDKIDHILSYNTTNLFNINNNNIKKKDEKEYKFLLTMFLYEYISPKIIIYKYKLSKYKFDILINQIIEEYNNSIVEPGEMVGSLGAQSIGEPTTQMTLNTFHATGSGVMGMQGVPRLRELISISKANKTPTMDIYLKDKTNHKTANIISSYINLTVFNDIIESYSIIYDTNKNGIIKEDDVSNMFQIFINNNKLNPENIPFILKLVVNKTVLIQKSISLLDIKTAFITFWKTNYSNIKNIKRQDKELITNIIACGIMTNNENSDIPIIHIRFDMKNYSNNYIINFKNLVLENFKIKGITNITDSNNVIERQFTTYDSNNDIDTQSEYILSTSGINMRGIRYIYGIDLNRTICNSVYMIYIYYGIEAARNVLIKELTSVFLSSGNDVNYHHLSILVDLITNNGTLISIDRHGLIKLDNDPLSKASFEKTVDVLMQAAIFNEVDNMNSVSSRIMSGRTINGGTCSFELLIDNELIENSELINQQIYSDNYTLIFEENELLNDILNRERIDCFIPN